ncbi:MAG TPA: hypothetical protein VHW72_13415, partial [Candidatus Angelobacter sp.]|nr:hypothetical protein [Candidatus Angelobacter sp.]
MSTPAQALSKVVSSNVEDQLKATGEAQVIVLLAPAQAGLAAVAKSAGPSQGLLNCFKLTEKSRWSAIARATSSLAKGAGLAAGAAVAMARQVAPVRHYPNLNLLFGNVDREGLQAISNSSEVVKITGAPQIGLIAPKRIA